MGCVVFEGPLCAVIVHDHYLRKYDHVVIVIVRAIRSDLARRDRHWLEEPLKCPSPHRRQIDFRPSTVKHGT